MLKEDHRFNQHTEEEKREQYVDYLYRKSKYYEGALREIVDIAKRTYFTETEVIALNALNDEPYHSRNLIMKK